MPLFSDLLALLAILQLAVSGSWTLASRLGSRKNCPACKGPPVAARGHTTGPRPGDDSTSVLALGEPCGVYTLSCARGLRCAPPSGDLSPLHALLQGRGVCSNTRSATVSPQTTESQLSTSEDLEKGPCRKQLNTVLRGLEVTVFQSDQDIYIPNCDKRGFYRKKQCRSSRGMQRGHCWCVGERGTLMPSRTGEDGTVTCNIA